MSEFIDPLAALPAFLLALLVFGFAPGFVLRLLVLLYPKGDLRRRELVAELYAMRRVERPMWVAEQIETSLFEGLFPRFGRLLRAARHPIRISRAIVRWVVGAYINDYTKSVNGRGELHRLVPFWVNETSDE